MVNRNVERSIAIFYPNGTCNLKCRYCNIDKNPALSTIDKLLEKSFEDPDYYLHRVQEYFDVWQLTRVETWGGEPFLGMHRILPLFRKLIDNYPNLVEFFSSTNFSFSTWRDEFWQLMDVFRSYPNRPFSYSLQLSVDGPEELNDFNRGKGVTERCLKNYNDFIEDIKAGKIPQNVHISAVIKNTLDIDSIRNLTTKQDIINYYKFFEDKYLKPIKELPEEFQTYISMNVPIPNMAVPTPTTVELGKIFARYVSMCREIEKEIANGKSELKYYQGITPFTTTANNTALSYISPKGYCGTGNSMVGFLPDNLIGICNEGFTEMVKDYKEDVDSGKYRLKDGTISFSHYINKDNCILCLTDEEYALHEQKMNTYNNPMQTSKLMSTVVQIIALAISGQIEEKYLDEIEALKAAIMIHARTAYCIKDNYNTNGTFTMIPLGTIKLFCNGALEYVMSEIEREELEHANFFNV